MVSMNQTIYLSPHGKMKKTPLINGNIVKAQLKSHYQQHESTHLILPVSSQLSFKNM